MPDCKTLKETGFMSNWIVYVVSFTPALTVKTEQLNVEERNESEKS